MQRIISIVLIIMVSATLVGGDQGELKAGAARVDLTPPLEWQFSLGGYGARMSKPAEGIHDKIWAKALVLSDGNKKYAIVTMDILALPPNVKPQVIELIQDEGWKLENVMMLPSHSHASLDMTALNDKNILNIPQLGIFHPKLLEFVVQSLANVITDANKNLQSVSVGSASAVIEGMNRNRRGDAVTDKECIVTRFDTNDGKPLAVLVNWTAHPTIMDDDDMWVSAGWPGYLQRELEAWIGGGVMVMYHNGAEGDQSVMGAQGGSHYEKAEDYGRKIAIRVYRTYQNIKVQSRPVFAFAYQKIKLPKRVPHPEFKATGGAEYGIDDQAMKVILEMMVPSQTMSGALRIGDLVIAGVPGEMISALGIQIKNQLRKRGVKYPVIGGFANEWVSYILSDKEYAEGGYEASVSFYGPTLGTTIVEGVLQTSRSLVE